MKVVIDTNIFVSAVIGKRLAIIIDMWKAGNFELVLTDDILKEYRDVLSRPKFRFHQNDVDEIIVNLFQKSSFVTPKDEIHVVKDDPTDNRFIEAAIAAKADIIVSGDKHLLDVGEYDGIPIIKAADFIRLINSTQELHSKAGGNK